ncbi:hypothetical protein [Runella zeae]|uniref:hypothetical protein n=1 Tax=Runella zeae TaxID=94255 RepID=UPI00041F6A5E|nr:hypothetical protein [Runella zeae]
MFNFFNKSKGTSSGIFIPDGSKFKEVVGDNIDNESFNGVAKYLGLNPDILHGYFTEGDNGIYSVAFEIFTKNVKFIQTSKDVVEVSESLVKKHIKGYDLDYDMLLSTAHDVLQEAIENESFDINFLQRALNLNDNSPNGILYSDKLGLYLYFSEGILYDFQPADGLNQWAKDWKKLNPKMLENYQKEALHYWGKSQIQKVQYEINKQADAWASMKNPIGSPFIHLHKTPFGNINYFNLLIAHQGEKATLDEFVTVNHGRFISIDTGDKTIKLQVGNFVYHFDETGEILGVRGIG